MGRVKQFIGTGFGSGFFPTAPGTAGSLAALIPIYFILRVDVRLLPVFVLVSSLLTLWVSSWFEHHYEKDSPKLVMDEWAGQALALMGIHLTDAFNTNMLILFTGFALFRLFDIWKPLGINKLQNLPGGWGVLADDLLAGLYALICLKTLIFIFYKFIG